MSKDLISASLKFHKDSLKKNQTSRKLTKDEKDKKLIQKQVAYETDSESDAEIESYQEIDQDTYTKYLPKQKNVKDSSDDEALKPVYRGAWSDDSEDESDQGTQESEQDSDKESDMEDENESNESDETDENAVKPAKWSNKDLHVSARERANKDTFEDKEHEAKEAAVIQKRRADRLKRSIQKNIETEYATESDSESEGSDDEEQTNEELEAELIKELKTKLEVVQQQLEPLLNKVRESGFSTHEGLSYLETKYQLLLSYCMNIIFFLTLKASGHSVEDHPVIEYLVEQRKLLEKVKPIDDRMKNQIDKLISLANSSEATATLNTEHEESDDSEEESNAKPNLADFMDEDVSDDSSVEESSSDKEYEDNDKAELPKKEELYVAPKLMAVSTNLDSREKKLSKYEKRKQKLTQRLVDSGILQDLAEDFGDAPIVKDGLSAVRNKGSKAVQFAKELEEYEMNNMRRVNLSKSQKKLLKEAERAVSKVDDELMDLEAYSEYIAHEAKSKKLEDEKVTVLEYLDNEEEARRFLEEQKNTRKEMNDSKKRKRIEEPDFDDDDESDSDIKSKKKRRLEEESQLEGKEDVGRRSAGTKELQNRGIRHNKRKDLKNSRVKYKKRFEETTSRQKSLEAQMEKLRGASGYLPKIDPGVVRSNKAK